MNNDLLCVDFCDLDFCDHTIWWDTIDQSDFGQRFQKFSFWGSNSHPILAKIMQPLVS